MLVQLVQMLVEIMHDGCIYGSLHGTRGVILHEPGGAAFFDKVSAGSIHNVIVFFNKLYGIHA